MKLTVKITGVCGIVKRGNNDLRILAASDNPLATTLVQQGHGQHHARATSHEPCSGRCVPRHRAFVRAKIKQNNDGDLKVVRPFKFQTSLDGGAGVYLCSNEVLVLRHVGELGSALPVVRIDPRDIVEMSKVAPTNFKTNEALVSSDYDPIGSRVAALMRLETGSVAAAKVDQLSIHKFEPTLGASAYAGAFAQEVDVVLNLPGAQWELVARSFREDDTTFEVLLQFNGAQNEFVFTFGNMSLADMVEADEAGEEEIDHHFDLIYRLLEEPPPVRSRPVRMSALRREVNFGGTNCPPVIIG